jgi:hypothetical protein
MLSAIHFFTYRSAAALVTVRLAGGRDIENVIAGKPYS